MTDEMGDAMTPRMDKRPSPLAAAWAAKDPSRCPFGYGRECLDIDCDLEHRNQCACNPFHGDTCADCEN